MKVVPIPKAKALAVLHFRDLIESMEATVLALELGPASVELVDDMIIRQARENLEYSRMADFIDGDPKAILLVEFAGDTAAELEARLDGLDERMRRSGLSYSNRRFVDPADQARVWAVRKAGLGLMMNVRGPAKPLPFVEDTAVPPEALPEYVRRFDEIVREHGTSAGYYGHASVGCLHIRPLIDLTAAEDVERMVSISAHVSDLVLEYGGAMSGEHGDGLARSVWNEKMFGSRIYGAFPGGQAGVRPRGGHEPRQDSRRAVDSGEPEGHAVDAAAANRDRAGLRRGGRPRRGRADVQRSGRLPQALRNDVPVLHGHARRGTLDPRPRQRPASRHDRRPACGQPDRRAASTA